MRKNTYGIAVDAFLKDHVDSLNDNTDVNGLMANYNRTFNMDIGGTS